MLNSAWSGQTTTSTWWTRRVSSPSNAMTTVRLSNLLPTDGSIYLVLLNWWQIPEMASFSKEDLLPNGSNESFICTMARFYTQGRGAKFGVLQARWAIVKGPARSRYMHYIDNVIYACIIFNYFSLYIFLTIPILHYKSCWTQSAYSVRTDGVFNFAIYNIWKKYNIKN